MDKILPHFKHIFQLSHFELILLTFFKKKRFKNTPTVNKRINYRSTYINILICFFFFLIGKNNTYSFLFLQIATSCPLCLMAMHLGQHLYGDKRANFKNHQFFGLSGRLRTMTKTHTNYSWVIGQAPLRKYCLWFV